MPSQFTTPIWLGTEVLHLVTLMYSCFKHTVKVKVMACGYTVSLFSLGLCFNKVKAMGSFINDSSLLISHTGLLSKPLQCKLCVFHHVCNVTMVIIFMAGVYNAGADFGILILTNHLSGKC